MQVNTKLLLVVICCSVVGVVTGINLKHTQKELVTIDAKLLIDEIASRAKESKIDDGFIERESICLTNAIDNIAKDYNYIVVPKQAVIAGSDDITSMVRTYIAEHCYV